MNFCMKISFVVPVYNVEKYMRQCIDSLLAQTYQDIELLLIDDGSTDNSPAICEEYSTKDERVFTFHKENGGLSDARNYGLTKANGDFVAFVDSDDYWSDEYQLQLLIDKINDYKGCVDVLQFNIIEYFQSENRRVEWPLFHESLLDKCERTEMIISLASSNKMPMSACSKLIKKEFLLDNNIIFKKGLISEDVPWFLELLLRAKYFVFVNNYVYVYRKNVLSSISSGFSDKKYNDLFSILSIETSKIENNDEWTSEQKKALLSFMAYEFAILLGLSYYYDKSIRKIKWRELKKFSYLLKYNCNPKVKKVSCLYNILGMGLTSFVLHVYLESKM